MMRVARWTVTVLLALGMMSAFVPASAADDPFGTRVEERTYHGGTGWDGVFFKAGPERHVVLGDMWFDLTGDETWGELEIRVDDDHRDEVAVAYQLYGPGHNDPSVTGGAGAALVSGYFCNDLDIEPPEDATRLRIVVNSAEAMDEDICSSDGLATEGTVQVKMIPKMEC